MAPDMVAGSELEKWVLAGAQQLQSRVKTQDLLAIRYYVSSWRGGIISRERR